MRRVSGVGGWGLRARGWGRAASVGRTSAPGGTGQIEQANPSADGPPPAAAGFVTLRLFAQRAEETADLKDKSALPRSLLGSCCLWCGGQEVEHFAELLHLLVVACPIALAEPVVFTQKYGKI